MKNPPLIAHIIHRLDVGGLENGLVNLINKIPRERYRHVIICLENYTDYRYRIIREDVEIIALNKRAGYDIKLYYKLFKVLRELKPDIVHTRNLAALEAQLIAVAARIKVRIHSEHGRDISDLKGENYKYNLLRKIIYPFVDHFITVSRDLEAWLVNLLGVSSNRISQIYNGVDNHRFSPGVPKNCELSPKDFFTENTFVIGSVGRLEAVKDYPNLVRSFLLILEKMPDARKYLRLIIVGNGSARDECVSLVQKAYAEDIVWFPGERSDIPEFMRMMNVFVLPSLGEGISNTILEAMSSGLPVVATRVGGNVELVEEARTGMLIAPNNTTDLMEAILTYYNNPQLLEAHGKSARQKINAEFSMVTMINNYLGVYDRVMRLVKVK
ncbi:TIGR03088 family PEP-CTERM/XrtA system glycosyltransferase [Nitrosomonas aestuarii]|uniref:TIGR03088 family PEP-CTERM/XrtA system glycosyltransferase n=1 Tax=Nitrosomonas aestuarii TaxID=52441 RepID=UPI000D2FB629|nr:TIGR03088 family PEP-CTERM/XrtA system glycosyltransferase [Nitrosomonas aestuarii]PTN11412.1 sugar transferase (PEP-CTERM/EpsH1 system associated) [Nitrosomonas aestuarii]